MKIHLAWIRVTATAAILAGAALCAASFVLTLAMPAPAAWLAARRRAP